MPTWPTSCEHGLCSISWKPDIHCHDHNYISKASRVHLPHILITSVFWYEYQKKKKKEKEKTTNKPKIATYLISLSSNCTYRVGAVYDTGLAVSSYQGYTMTPVFPWHRVYLIIPYGCKIGKFTMFFYHREKRHIRRELFTDGEAVKTNICFSIIWLMMVCPAVCAIPPVRLAI